MSRSAEGKLIHIPLVSGMDQSFDENLAPPGTFTTVQNLRVKNNGVLEPKCGQATLAGTCATNRVSLVGDSSVYTENPCFATRVGETDVLATTAGQIFARDDQDVFHLAGSNPTAFPCGTVGTLMAATPSNAITSGCPAITRFGDGSTTEYFMVVAIEATFLAGYIATGDGVVLARINPGSVTAQKVQLLRLSTTQALMVYQNGTAIRGVTYTVTNGVVTVGTDTSLATLTSSSSHWDTSNVPGSTTWYLVYQSAAAVMTVARYSTVTVQQGRNIAVTGTVPVSCWATPGGLNLWFGWYDNPTVSGDVKFQVVLSGNLNSDVKTATTITSAANIYGAPRFGKYRAQMSGSSTSDGSLHAFTIFPRRSSNGERATMTCVAFSDASAPTSPVSITGTYPVSKPDNYHRWWVITATNSSNNVFQQYALLRLDDSGSGVGPRVELSSPKFPTLGTQSPAEVTATQGWFHSQAINDTSLGYSYFAFPINLVDVSSAPFVKIPVYRYQTGNQYPWQEVEPLGLTTVMAGQPTEIYGQPLDATVTVSTTVTGRRTGGAAECGFLHAPTILTAAQASGSGVLPGTYRYKAVYEWVDIYGRRHQSADSKDVAVTVTVDDQVDLTITTLDASQRQQVLYSHIRLYRTLANGQEYKLLPNIISATDTTGVISFSDTNSDSSIQNNGTIYTDGGILAHDLAPSCRFTAKAEDRVWCGGLWDPNIIQCSKIILPGEPVQFSQAEAFQVPIGGACTGLAYQDGTVIAFTRNEIWVIDGEGPNDQGVGGFTARRISADIGCLDHKSIVEDRTGVYFQAERGIYRIPRGMGPVEFVGAKVRNTLSTSIIKGAVSVDNLDGHYIHFASYGGSALTYSNVLVYDAENDNWFQDSGIGGGSGVVLGSWGGGKPVYIGTLSSALAIKYDDPGTNPASTLRCIITTAWLRPFGPAGWGALKRLVASLGAAGGDIPWLKIQVEIDDRITGSGNELTKEWLVSSVYPFYRGAVMGPVQQGTGFRITVSNVSSSGQVSGSYKFISISLEVEDEGKLRLLSPDES